MPPSRRNLAGWHTCHPKIYNKYHKQNKNK
uniref:Uncharacterized protein n=1 Tax=Anguilla anguilla TaxID=7936 RepID=A0A0E9QH87_ANGAN